MKKDQAILNTILGLSGFVVGAILITNLVRNSSKKTDTSKKDVVVEKESKKIDESLNQRQKKAIEILLAQGRVTVKELVAHFPKISTRTLRRDMDALADKGYVSQEGSTKSTYYRYIAKEYNGYNFSPYSNKI